MIEYRVNPKTSYGKGKKPKLDGVDIIRDKKIPVDVIAAYEGDRLRGVVALTEAAEPEARAFKLENFKVGPSSYVPEL